MEWDLGRQANNSSSTVIKMLKRLLTTGFDKNVSIELINSAINLNSNSETYATIDIAIIDLTNGNIEFIKMKSHFKASKKSISQSVTCKKPYGILNHLLLWKVYINKNKTFNQLKFQKKYS